MLKKIEIIFFLPIHSCPSEDQLCLPNNSPLHCETMSHTNQEDDSIEALEKSQNDEIGSGKKKREKSIHWGKKPKLQKKEAPGGSAEEMMRF